MQVVAQVVESDILYSFMMVLRPTAKLLAHLRVQKATNPPVSTTLLGDWFATLLVVRSGRFVLAVSGATLLPVVVHGRQLSTLPNRLADAVGEVLTALSVKPDAITRECAAMEEVRIAATNDRSTVGVMIDLRHLLRAYLAGDPNATLLELSLKLAKTPIVARNAFPDRETRRVFGVDVR